MFRYIAKSMSFILIICFLATNLTATYAKAAMIETEAVVNSLQSENSRTRIAAFLDRKEVIEAFEKQGIDPEQAKNRIANLTDAEVAKINQMLDQMPAGGDGLGVVIGAIVFIFVVLLITDIVGLTNVFPFVHHPRR